MVKSIPTGDYLLKITSIRFLKGNFLEIIGHIEEGPQKGQMLEKVYNLNNEKSTIPLCDDLNKLLSGNVVKVDWTNTSTFRLLDF